MEKVLAADGVPVVREPPGLVAPHRPDLAWVDAGVTHVVDVKVTTRAFQAVEAQVAYEYAGMAAVVHPFVVGVLGDLADAAQALLRVHGVKSRDLSQASVAFARDNAEVARVYNRRVCQVMWR